MFTKWIEAKALSSIAAMTMQKIFWHNIIYRFGVLKEITVDNGKQFDYDAFRNFCTNMGTKVFGISPSVKWRSGKSQPNYIFHNKENAF